MTDIERVIDIKNRIEALNKALKEAGMVGLRVDIDTRTDVANVANGVAFPNIKLTSAVRKYPT